MSLTFLLDFRYSIKFPGKEPYLLSPYLISCNELNILNVKIYGTRTRTRNSVSCLYLGHKRRGLFTMTPVNLVFVCHSYNEQIPDNSNTYTQKVNRICVHIKFAKSGVVKTVISEMETSKQN